MKKLIGLAALLGGSLLPMVPPAADKVVVHEPGRTLVFPNQRAAPRYMRSRSRSRRARNTAIGAAGGAAVEGLVPVPSSVAPLAHSHRDAIGEKACEDRETEGAARSRGKSATRTLSLGRAIQPA